MSRANSNSLNVVNVRLVKEPSLYSAEPITSPEDVVRIVAKELASYDREVFAILNIKSNGQIINLNICSMGTLNASLVSPREVFKSSILSNAASFIAVHNHPSGSITPSHEDIETTKRLKACGDLLDIRMLVQFQRKRTHGSYAKQGSLGAMIPAPKGALHTTLHF